MLSPIWILGVAGAILLVAVVGIVVIWAILRRARRKVPPKASAHDRSSVAPMQTQANTIAGLLGDCVELRVRHMAAGSDPETMRALDECIDLIVSSVGGDAMDGTLIKGLQDTMRTRMGPDKAHSASDLDKALAVIQELLLLYSAGTVAEDELRRVIRSSLRSLKESHPILAAPARSDRKVSDLRVGDYVLVQEATYRVESIADYEENYQDRQYRWYDATVRRLRDGTETYISWEWEGRLYATLVLEELSLDDLRITEADLTRMDDSEEGSVSVRGERFEYEDSGEAWASIDGGQREPVYYFEFESRSGTRFVSIEKAAGRPEAFLSELLDLNQVVVLPLDR